MAMQIADVFTFEQAQEMQRSYQIVSVKKAHSFLHELRASLTEAQPVDGDWGFTQEVVDLTDCARFNWKGYLANHSQDWLENIFGPDLGQGGFCRFEGRFCRGWDVNMTYGVKGTRQRRFDFVGWRVDGVCWRFHPSGKGETCPVAGDPHYLALMHEHFGWLSAMTSSGGAPAASQEYMYHGASQHDVVGDKEAQAFLMKRVQTWEEAQGTARFTTDLTDGLTFAWDHFLARSPYSKEVAARGVTQCWLVWVGREQQRAGFYLRFRDDSETVYARFSKEWRCADSMVSDILWHV